jgi:signal-transduction protein with cAMP-binding, CBS, and nucleotidyltransferase domain
MRIHTCVLGRAAFRAVFFGAVQSGILEALRRVPELQGLKFSQLRDLASKMEERPRVWQAGEAVVEPEQAGFYMVRQGTAEVRDEAGQALQTLRELDYVGVSQSVGRWEDNDDDNNE